MNQTAYQQAIEPPAQLVDWLKQIEYKIGWRFWLTPAHLEVAVATYDSSSSAHHLIQQHFLFSLPGMPMFETSRRFTHVFENEEEFRAWILEKFVWIEVHEIREFFRWKGAQIFQPHCGGPWPFSVRALRRPKFWNDQEEITGALP